MMKPQMTVPPPSELQFLMSLLRISFPGQPATPQSQAIGELLTAKTPR